MRDIEVEALGTDELADLARRQTRTWTRAAVGLLPEDTDRVDGHCHLGVDTDGSRIDEAALLAQLDRAGMRHAIVVPLHHEAGYAEENPRVRAVAAASGGRFHALHRCDPRNSDPAADAEQGLAEGAIGLKWHPRGERFGVADDVAQTTAAVAGAAGVPILIHAGRGMERLGEGVVELARQHPRATFILAHAAVSDLSWIVDATTDVPNIVFDTSWWRPTDIAVLLTCAPPSRVVHGSDPPYGSAELGVQITARLARGCGWDDAQVAALMGGNSRRIFGIGDEPALAGSLDMGGARHMPVEFPAFRRASELLASALQVQFGGGDPEEVFDLACSALDLPSAHERQRDAALLQGCIRVATALLDRTLVGLPGDLPPFAVMGTPTGRRAIELLMGALVHLATPELPIIGIERTGWSEDS
ncbi:MAG: amidohydrolase 2 [Thermoleophilia bacterium]|nr:amidohydrolase 2 [Thermoleophilia bacterium]